MRNLVTILAVMLCLVSVCALIVQRQNLNSLRAVQPQQSAQVEPAAESMRETRDQASAAPAAETASELLQLRSQVTRLKARQRELAGVPAEAERLRAQLASNGTNTSGVALPPGYIRKAEARMAGYSTPENTIESFLWALQNHDFTNLLQALTPATAQHLQAEAARSGQSASAFFADTVFNQSDPLPGMAIRGREKNPDGSVILLMESVPGMPVQTILMLPTNGEWKMNWPF